MRLLFVTHYFPPEVGAAQTRILELATELSRRGHEVTVLTGLPNYPDGIVRPPYRWRLFQRERAGGLRVLRTAVYPAPNRGVARRLLNHASFALAAVPASLAAGRPEVVIVETPPLFSALAGVAVAAIKRAPLVLSVADLWLDAAIEFEALRHHTVIAVARRLERFAYRRARVLAVPTPGLEAVLRERGYGDQVVLVPHGVDLARFPPQHDGPVPGRIVYCGTIGMGHAVGTLIEAARILGEREAGYEILIVGDGAERRALEAGVERDELRSVSFAGSVPRGDLPALLASAEVTVATQRDAPLLAAALSTKVLEYMAAGRPVVAAVAGWTADVILRAGAGLVCPPEQPAALAQAIARVTAEPERALAMGRNGRRYVEQHLSRQVSVDRLDGALASLAPGAAASHSAAGAHAA